MLKKAVSVCLAVLMVAGLVPASVFGVFADDGGRTADYTLSLGQRTVVEITEGGQEKNCAFTPAEDDTYVFESFGNGDTFATLYSADGSYLDENNEGGSGNNFRITAELSAGVTYYLASRFYYSDTTGSFEVEVDTVPHAETLQIREGNTFEGYVGTSMYLHTDLLPAGSAYEEIGWASSNNAVVSVDEEGYATLLDAGTATVTATSARGLTASIAITVVAAESIAVDEVKHCVTTVGGQQFLYRFVPDETRQYLFYSTGSLDTYGVLLDSDMDEFTSDDDSGENNNFRFQCSLTAGEVYYYRVQLYGENTGAFDVTVEKIAYATGMALDRSSVTGYAGYTKQLEPAFLPEGSMAESVTWESSDNTVATVDSYGMVTMVAAGSATITATSENGLTATCAVTVKPEEVLTLGTAVTAEMIEEYYFVLYRFTAPADGSYDFYSENTNGDQTLGFLFDENKNELAYENSNVDGSRFQIRYTLQQGKTYYLHTSYSYGNIGSYTVGVRVSPAATGMEIVQGAAVEGYQGTVKYLSVRFLPLDAVSQEVSWTSSNDAVASVDSDGAVSLNATGTATITAATVSGFSASCTVTVKAYESLQVGDTKEVVIADGGDMAYFSFVPQTSGSYSFFSVGSEDTYGLLYDANMHQITYDDDGGEGRNFLIRRDLTAGEAVVYGAKFYSGTRTGSFSVKLQKNAAATGLAIRQGETFTGKIYEGIDFEADFLPEGAYTEQLTWSSSDENVVFFYPNSNHAEFGAVGSAVVTATSANGLTATCTVTVQDHETIEKGESKSFTFDETHTKQVYKVTPAQNYAASFFTTGSCSTYGVLKNRYGSEMASSTSGGTGDNFKLDHALEAGEIYYIYVYRYDGVGDVTLTCEEIPTATSMSFTQGSAISAESGRTVDLTVAFAPAGCLTEEVVSWTSSDEGVATVDDNGRVRLYSSGSAVITATSENGLTATCTVTSVVYEQIYVGETKTVSLDSAADFERFRFVPEEDGGYIFYSTGSCATWGGLYDDDMTLFCSASSGGEGNNFRFSTMLAQGETYYFETRMNGGAAGSYQIGVERVPDATSVSFAQGESISGYVDSSITMRPVFLPEDAALQSGTLSSSNGSVVSVSGYTLYLNALGEADVTFTSEKGLTAVCHVTVRDYDTMTVGETKSADILYAGGRAVYRLTPAEDTAAVFCSMSNKDTYGTLYDANWNSVKENDDSGDGYNFRLQHELKGGQTYYLEARFYGNNTTGHLTVVSEELPYAESLAFLEGTAVDAYLPFAPALNVIAVPEDAFVGGLTWSSSDSSVVSVNSSNEIVLEGLGTAVVTATNTRGTSASCTLTVKDYEVLTTGETETAVINYRNKHIIYAFTPDEGDHYAFYSEGDEDSYAMLYDSNWNMVAFDDDNGEDSNFRITQGLTAGETYYLEVFLANKNDTGSFTVGVTQTPYVTDLEIVSLPDRLTYVSGFVYSYLDYSGLSVKTTWSDGEVVNWTYGEEQRIRGEQLNFMCNGSDVNVVCGDCSQTFALNVINDPVQSLTVTQGTSATLIEETDGFWSRYNGEEYFRYEYGTLSDIEVEIAYYDGTVKTAHVGDVVDGYPVYAWDEQHDEPWTVGSDNALTVSYLSGSAATTITVEPSPVESLEILNGPTDHLMENADGYVTSRYNEDTGSYEEFFFYDLGVLNDVKVRIHYKDGTTTDAFIGKTVDGYKINANGHQEETPFTVGSNNEVTVSYMGKTAVVQVTVDENPVSGIELESPSAYTLIEGVNIDKRERYDSALGKTVPYDYYYLSRLNDAVIRIRFKDGTSQTAHVGQSVNGYYISTRDNQASRPYTIGGENVYEVEYLGHRLEMHATLTESPVESIELTEPFAPVLIEHVDGSWRGDDVPFFRYNIPNMSGVYVRVHFKDGTEKIARVYSELDGLAVSVEDDQYQHPWTLGGDNAYYVTYGGKRTAVPVTIIENPVTGIAVTKNTTATLIENGDGYWNTRYNPDTGEYDLDYFTYSLPDMSDAEVTISYADGTSQTAHIGDMIDGYRISADSDQYEHPWTLGTNSVTVYYMGSEAVMPIQVVETPVASITVDSAPSRVYVYGDKAYGSVNYFMPTDYTGLQFTVHFKDGTAATYTDADITNNGMIDGHRFETEVNGVETVGSNAVTLRYMGVEATYQVNVRESNVSAIEVVRLPDHPVYADYYAPDWSGMQVRFTKKNGSTEIVTLSDANIVYDRSNYYGAYVGFVYDGAMAIISTLYDESDLQDFRVIYAELSADIEGMQYREDKEVADVQVEDFSLTGENMLLKVTYADGTKENIRLTDVKDCSITWAWASDVYLCRVMTDKGLLSVYTTESDRMAFNVSVFGIDVKCDSSGALLGDVTGDGVVNIDDATRLQSYLAEFSVPGTANILLCGDTDGNGKINVRDVTALQRYLADIENSTGIGEPIA